MRNEWYVPSPPYASPPLNSQCVCLCHLSICVPPDSMWDVLFIRAYWSVLRLVLCVQRRHSPPGEDVCMFLNVCDGFAWLKSPPVMCDVAFIQFVTAHTPFIKVFLQIKRRKPWPQMGGRAVEAMRGRRGKVQDRRYQKCEVWVLLVKALPGRCRSTGVPVSPPVAHTCVSWVMWLFSSF